MAVAAGSEESASLNRQIGKLWVADPMYDHVHARASALGIPKTEYVRQLIARDMMGNNHHEFFSAFAQGQERILAQQSDILARLTGRSNYMDLSGWNQITITVKLQDGTSIDYVNEAVETFVVGELGTTEYTYSVEPATEDKHGES